MRTSPRGLPWPHRFVLACHRWLLSRFQDRFPDPWAADAHETATTRVITHHQTDGWVAALRTALAECADVAGVGLAGVLHDAVAWPGELMRDVRHALRRLLTRPVRSLVLILTLAVGIGASTALFSVVNNTLLRPMMLRDIDGLVRIDDVTPDGAQTSNVSPLNADLLAAGSSTLSQVIVQDYRPFVLTGDGEPERLRGSGVSTGFTAGLGIAPVLGRTFTPEEHRLGADAPSVLVSYDLWQRRWGGDPDILGAVAVLNGRPRTVVGVLPRGFHFPYEANVWVPLSTDVTNASGHYLLVFGRMAPGVALPAVQRELDAISADARRAAPRENENVTLTAMPLRDNLVRGYDRTALALLSVVGFLLLVGAVNVAGVSLAEAQRRSREMAIRASLGATRRRQVAQLLAESTVVSFLGGAAGLGLSVLMRPFLSLLVPPVMSVELAQDDIALDHHVVLFAAGAAAVAAIVSGVLPALRTSVRDLAGALRAGEGPGQAQGTRSGLAVVALEVALAMVLLTGAASVAGGYLQDRWRPLGYRPDGVLSVRASLPESRYPDDARRVQMVDQLAERVGALPGVAAAGVSTGNPALGGWVERVSNHEGGTARDAVETHLSFVSSGFFAGLGITILSGRPLTADDDRGPPSAVVSTSLARRLWGDPRAAVGRTLVLPEGDASATSFTVVGVCADLREADEVASGVYLPYARHQGRFPAQEIDLFVRAAAGSEAAGLASAVRAAVHEMDPDLALFGVLPQSQVSSRASALEGAGALLAAGLMGFGLLLSALGVFGIMANVAARSLSALGIRKALGARSPALARAALVPTLVAIAAGIGIGAGGAWLVTSVVGARLGAAGPPGAPLYAVVAAVLTAVALLSALGPVVRAVRVDPVRVLRADW